MYRTAKRNATQPAHEDQATPAPDSRTSLLAASSSGVVHRLRDSAVTGTDQDIALPSTAQVESVRRTPEYETPANSSSSGNSTLNSILAGGIFQDLRYPIWRDFPGPQQGTFASYDLSFRDFSGFSNPTSHAYLNRTLPAASSWKGLRLDYGPNVATNGMSNWHWNQSGAAAAFDVADHALASPTAQIFGNMMQVAKPLGRGMSILGAGMDGYSLGTEINKSMDTGNWTNTTSTGASIAGGWGGAYAGAELGGMGGATLGAFTGPAAPIAIPILGALGGLAGGAGGYFGGSAFGGWAHDKAYQGYNWLFGNDQP